MGPVAQRDIRRCHPGRDPDHSSRANPEGADRGGEARPPPRRSRTRCLMGTDEKVILMDHAFMTTPEGLAFMALQTRADLADNLRFLEVEQEFNAKEIQRLHLSREATLALIDAID